MKRRLALASLATAGVYPLRAQRQAHPARIAYLSLRAGPNEFERAFLRGMQVRGLVENTHFVVDYRWAAFDVQRLQSMATDAMVTRPDVVVAPDGAAGIVRSLNRAIPIVAVAMADPISSGYTSSLERPDGGITGMAVSTADTARTRLELFKQALPSLQRVGALYDGARPVRAELAVTHSTGEALGIRTIEMALALPDGIGDGFAAARRAGVQGVVILSDTATVAYRAPLCDAALRHRLPTIFPNRTYLMAGGLMSYGPDVEDAFSRAAYYVERILKGVRPADLPIEPVTRFELVVNVDTIIALELALPQSFLLRADTVVDRSPRW